MISTLWMFLRQELSENKTRFATILLPFKVRQRLIDGFGCSAVVVPE
jgi:hypothetical protein